MKKIISELSRIQQELKAPKNLFNSFGNYKYRNAEGILEAVKPMLNGLALVINDEPVVIGERYYIKAVATLTDGEESVSATAYAREDEFKKGMDGCQLSGACSSYARKYALNALLMIDDSKDSDDDSLSPKNPANMEKPTKKETNPAPKNTVQTPPPVNDVKSYIQRELETMQAAFGYPTSDETLKKFAEMRKALIESGAVPNTAKIATIEEAKATFDAIYKTFSPSEVSA